MTWSLILAAVGIAGLVIAGRRSAWGWFIGLMAQILWIIYALVTQQYGFILSALAYGFVYAQNFVKWRRDAHTQGQGAHRERRRRHARLAGAHQGAGERLSGRGDAPEQEEAAWSNPPGD